MSESAPRPRFSLVSAVYGVERYLPDFIASVEAQDFDLSRVEVIAVDDGSTDGSSEQLARWAARRPDLVTVVRKENGGQASARNAGLDLATGEWVAFPDPDDTLAPDYLSQVDRALQRQPRAEMVATHRVNIDGATGEEIRHPLWMHFNERDQVRNLDNDPDFFAGHAPSTFFRTDRVDEQHLRFDEAIRPNFEDGHFCCRYLLALETPLVSFLRSAKYRYLKRSDNTSTLSGSRGVASRYTTVLERGYLDVLRRAAARYGAPPVWLQTYVLYELSWYFREGEAGSGEPGAPASVTGRMHELMAQIAALLSPEVVETYWLTRLDTQWRDALVHGYADRAWHASYARIDNLDERQRLLRLRYHYTGDLPPETLIVNGREVRPAYAKERSVRFFDQEVLRERVVWLPTGSVRLLLDGAPVQVLAEPPPRPSYALRLWRVKQQLEPGPLEDPPLTGPPAPPKSLADRALLRLARSRVVTRYFADAWVLIDRIADADDSAEVLFRWMRTHRREVNAWFVVARRSPDHQRLRRDGYKRVVAHGSLVWRLLMLNAAQVVSSHADREIVAPEELTRLVRPTWRTAFLNHGVIKDDLSQWLNPKNFDVFVTSTPAEYESVAGGRTGYHYTSREVTQSGMPRLDQLREAAGRVPEDERRLLLLAPTWRNWLVDLTQLHKPPLPLEEFLRTDFATSWLGLARSPELAETAKQHGLQVAMLLHPNLQPMQSRLDLPGHVLPLTFADGRVRDHFARARTLVTDYSSMAFNAAYLDRPVVYFQFDRERVMSGAHMGRAGYFDYERDGFGPVAPSLPEVLEAIAAVTAERAPQEPYRSRVAKAFPERDGRCTERTFEAIERSMRAVPRKTLFTSSVPPE